MKQYQLKLTFLGNMLKFLLLFTIITNGVQNIEAKTIEEARCEVKCYADAPCMIMPDPEALWVKAAKF